MAVLDYHILLALQEGWAHYRDNETAFVELFENIPEALLLRWHAELAATDEQKKVKFLSAWSPHGELPPPVVVVELGDERPSELPLGEFAERDADDHREILGEVLEQDVTITVMTTSFDLLRALHVVIKAVLKTARKAFLKGGYETFHYVGVDPLSPEERLVADSMNMAIRRQRWSSIVVDYTPVREETTMKTWFVAPWDVEVDGEAGGVSAITGDDEEQEEQPQGDMTVPPPGEL